MEDKRRQAKIQIKFCTELMDRLNGLLDENINENSFCHGIRNHTQISSDIVRLRRELNILNKLMNPYN